MSGPCASRIYGMLPPSFGIPQILQECPILGFASRTSLLYLRRNVPLDPSKYIKAYLYGGTAKWVGYGVVAIAEPPEQQDEPTIVCEPVDENCKPWQKCKQRCTVMYSRIPRITFEAETTFNPHPMKLETCCKACERARELEQLCRACRSALPPCRDASDRYSYVRYPLPDACKKCGAATRNEAEDAVQRIRFEAKFCWETWCGMARSTNISVSLATAASRTYTTGQKEGI
jgi:hypothetical protein